MTRIPPEGLPGRRTGRPARHLWVAAVALTLAACGGTTSPPPASSPSVPGGPSASAGSGTTSPSIAPSSAPPSVGAVAIDPSLLRFVPASGKGLTLTFDPATTQRVATDPGLAADVAALAIGLYTRLPTGASASPSDDFAIVNVVRLRDPSLGDDWFRDWRDSYDEAACASAGGVTRHAQTDIGGKTFFIGSCAGGAFTYHVRLPGAGIVVSITSVGPGRIGEEVVSGIGG